MEERCLDIERIDEVVHLPADHPVRRHVEGCPRCRNLLRSYEKFLRAEPVAGFNVESARRTLDALIASKVGEQRPAASQRSSTSYSDLVRGFLRPAPLIAAVAVVILVAAVVWRHTSERDGILLRDEASRSAALPPAEVRPDGSIHLSWPAVQGADTYQVRIYGPNLTEIYRHPDVSETSVVIDRSSLPSDLPPALDLMWRVYAIQSGDVIEASEPGSLRIR